MNVESFGGIRLVNADCMEVMRELPDNAFDLAICDPPYWDADECTSRIRTTGYVQSPLKFRVGGGKPNTEYMEQLSRVSKNQIIWGANNYGVPFKGFIVWEKTNIPDNFTMSRCEIASVSVGLSKVCKMVRIPSTKPGETRIHPTQKPVSLYKWILDRYAKPGDKILDTHLGSGSICIAAHDLGFEMLGVELDAQYYEAAKNRLLIHQAQLTLFENV